VRIKLDENLPRRAAAVFDNAGHDVDTVEDEGLAGAPDPSVARAATNADRLIVTLDRGFGDIQSYPPGSHSGIVVLRVDDHSASAIVAALTALVSSTDLDSLKKCVAVYRDGELRVRRPHR